jgi:hypothetical protein
VKTNSSILSTGLGKKLTVILFLSAIAVGAFATLGDGKTRKNNPGQKSLLSAKTTARPGYFSLTSGYDYRGSHVINPQRQTYINIDMQMSFQNGHTSYIVPMKKKLMNDKIVFNPNAATRN